MVVRQRARVCGDDGVMAFDRLRAYLQEYADRGRRLKKLSFPSLNFADMESCRSFKDLVDALIVDVYLDERDWVPKTPSNDAVREGIRFVDSRPLII